MTTKATAVQEDPVRAVLRADYEHGRNNRWKMTLEYDEFVAVTSDNQRSLESIAEEFGMTRQGVSLLYRKYVAPLNCGRHRTEFGKEARARKHLAHMLSVPDLSTVVREATVAGCAVAPVHTTNSVLSIKQLCINGKHCGLRIATSPSVPSFSSLREYARFSVNVIRWAQMDALVLISRVPEYPERLFIVPMGVFRELAGEYGRERVQVNLPLMKLPVYNNMYPLVDWWQYENAWNLLK